MMQLADFKTLTVHFVDTEITPKSSNKSSFRCNALGVAMPFIIDGFVTEYGEFLHMLRILDGNMIDIDQAEKYFAEVLTKTGGVSKLGITLYAEDVHRLADMARQM